MMDFDTRERAIALLRAVLEEDEQAADGVLSALTEAEAEEVSEKIELTGHLLDVHLGYAEACADTIGHEIKRLSSFGG